MSGKGRSFSREMNDKLRDVARELRRAHKSDRAFAAALGVAQPTVTNFLNGGNAGILLAAHVAQAAGLTLIIDRNGARIGDVELPNACYIVPDLFDCHGGLWGVLIEVQEQAPGL